MLTRVYSISLYFRTGLTLEFWLRGSRPARNRLPPARFRPESPAARPTWLYSHWFSKYRERERS